MAAWVAVAVACRWRMPDPGVPWMRRAVRQSAARHSGMIAARPRPGSACAAGGTGLPGFHAPPRGGRIRLVVRQADKQMAECAHLPRPPRLADTLSRSLQGWVREGRLAEGDRLPTEKQLCERFGVSRAVVREAIARLQADGVITGGMIPKLETCIHAVEAGCEAAVVLDGRVPHAMLLEFFTARGAGTLIRAGNRAAAQTG